MTMQYLKQVVYITTEPMAVRIDEASGTVMYIGEALPGSATAAAVWSIKRVTTTSGTVVQWADGNCTKDNVWDNRASLNYS
jgi:hypothetical protein